jgi:hypothetical protein
MGLRAAFGPEVTRRGCRLFDVPSKLVRAARDLLNSSCGSPLRANSVAGRISVNAYDSVFLLLQRRRRQ